MSGRRNLQADRDTVEKAEVFRGMGSIGLS